MNKKLTKIVLVVLAVVMAASLFAGQVNSEKAIKTFSSELQNVKKALDKGKMSNTQAMILLSAIRTRENLVIIKQNSEIINLLKKQKNNGGSK